MGYIADTLRAAKVSADTRLAQSLFGGVDPTLVDGWAPAPKTPSEQSELGKLYDAATGGKAGSYVADNYATPLAGALSDWYQNNSAGQVALDVAAAPAKALTALGRGFVGDIQDARSNPYDPMKSFMLAADVGMLAAPGAALGGVPKGALGMNVWQGGPHKYGAEGAAKSLEHMGKGEGSQAYGWGRYDAGNRDVAQVYHDQLGNVVDAVDGVPTTTPQEGWAVQALKNFNNKPDEAKAYMQTMADAGLFKGKDQEWINSYLGEVNQHIDAFSGKNLDSGIQGYLYKHDLPDEDIARYLDYDKSIKGQGEALEKLANEYGVSPTADVGTLLEVMKPKVGPKGFSDAASRAGFPGMQYYDGMSRGAGEGTRNYVTWDQGVLDKMKLLERNGEQMGTIAQSLIR